MNEKHDYYLEPMSKILWNENRNVIPVSGCYFYQVTRQEIEKIAMGICIGLKCRYKNPNVRVFEKTDNGGCKFVFEQK